MAGLILAAPFILLLLIAFAFSMVRGVTKSRIRLVCVILCAVVAFLITINLSPTVETTFEENKEQIAEQIENDETMQEAWGYFSESESLQEVVLQVGMALIAPFLFVGLFNLLRFVTWIIYFIVTLLLRSKIKAKEETRRARVPRSLVYGLVQFIIIAFVLLSPVYVLAQSWEAVENVIVEMDLVDENGRSILEDYEVGSVKNNFLMNTYGVLGGNAISERLTQITITTTKDEEGNPTVLKTTLKAELDAIAPIIKDVGVLAKAGDLKNYGDEEAEAIGSLIEHFLDSKILTSVLSEVVHDATESWLAGDTFIGVEVPALGGEESMLDFTQFVNTLLQDLYDSSESTEGFGNNLRTVAEILKVLIRDDILANIDNSDQLMEILGNGSTVQDLVRTIGNNSNLNNLIDEFAALSLRAIGAILNLPENSEEVFNKFIDDLTEAINLLRGLDLTDEATINQLADAIAEAMEESGVEFDLDPSVIRMYAKSILSDLGRYINEGDGVTREEVIDFFRIYSATIADEADSSSDNAGATDPVAFYTYLADEEETFTSRAYSGKSLKELKSQSAAGVLGAVTSDIAKASASSDGDETAFSATVQEIVDRRMNEYASATGNNDAAAALRAGLSSDAANLKHDTLTNDMVQGSSKIAPDSFPTVIVTMKDLVGSGSAGSGSSLNSAEAIDNEAKAISQILSGAIKIKDQVSGEGMTMSDLTGITESLGEILDGLNQTSSVGEGKTSKLVTAVFQSKAVTDAMNLDVKTATEIAKQATAKDEEGNISYTETMKSIGRGAAIAEKIGQSDEPISEDEIRELLEDMTPQTAGMLEVYMTGSRMTGYGISAAYAEKSALLLKNLFAEMAQKSKYANSYSEQTSAILKIFDIAIAAKSAGTGKALFNHGEVEGLLKMTAQEAVDTVMGAEMVVNAVYKTVTDENGQIKEGFVNPFGLHIPETSEDYIDCVAALKNYYNNYQGDKTTLALELNAVAAVLGVSPIEYN